MNFDKLIYITALKIMADQQSLTITAAFVTTEKLLQMVTMTANTQVQQKLLTTAIMFFTTF